MRRGGGVWQWGGNGVAMGTAAAQRQRGGAPLEQRQSHSKAGWREAQGQADCRSGCRQADQRPRSRQEAGGQGGACTARPAIRIMGTPQAQKRLAAAQRFARRAPRPARPKQEHPPGICGTAQQHQVWVRRAGVGAVGPSCPSCRDGAVGLLIRELVRDAHPGGHHLGLRDLAPGPQHHAHAHRVAHLARGRRPPVGKGLTARTAQEKDRHACCCVLLQRLWTAWDAVGKGARIRAWPRMVRRKSSARMRSVVDAPAGLAKTSICTAPPAGASGPPGLP